MRIGLAKSNEISCGKSWVVWNMKIQAYLENILQILLLTSLSDLCLRLSSNKSFIAVTDNTNNSGIIATSLPKAFIAGTQFNIMMDRK